MMMEGKLGKTIFLKKKEDNSGDNFPPSDVGFERVGVRFGDAGVLRLAEVIDAGAVVERGVRAVNGS